MQLIQMVVGCIVNIGVYNMKQDGLECNVSDQNIKLSFLMYTSYFVLFGHFFYDKYIAPKPAKATPAVGTIKNGKVTASKNDGFTNKTAKVKSEKKKLR